MIVRKATVEDSETIADFNIAMAFETEKKVLSKDLIYPGVKKVFTNNQLGFYLVAEESGSVISCLMVTYEWSDWRNSCFWWIQSVYVKSEYRRKGIFTQMYKAVESMAKDSGNVCGLRLYVEKENINAQNTYYKMGMNNTDYKMFEIEF